MDKISLILQRSLRTDMGGTFEYRIIRNFFSCCFIIIQRNPYNVPAAGYDIFISKPFQKKILPDTWTKPFKKAIRAVQGDIALGLVQDLDPDFSSLAIKLKHLIESYRLPGGGKKKCMTQMSLPGKST